MVARTTLTLQNNTHRRRSAPRRPPRNAMSGNALGRPFKYWVRRAALRIIRSAPLAPIPVWDIVRGDTVHVLSGRSAGKTGKVLSVYRRKNRVVVEGLNLVRVLRPPPPGDAAAAAAARRGAPAACRASRLRRPVPAAAPRAGQAARARPAQRAGRRHFQGVAHPLQQLGACGPAHRVRAPRRRRAPSRARAACAQPRCSSGAPRAADSCPLPPLAPPTPTHLCSKQTRISHRFTDDGARVRVSKRSGSIIPTPPEAISRGSMIKGARAGRGLRAASCASCCPAGAAAMRGTRCPR